MKITEASQPIIVAEPGEHVVLTGPIQGTVTLADGTVVDVSNPAVLATDDLQAAEIADAIGKHWEKPENVHPNQPDDPAGFVYDDSHYKAAKKAAASKKG